MIEQDNNGMKTPWTELEFGNSCYSSYIVEPIFVPKETAFWLCRPDGTREASRLTFAVFSQRGTDEWEDDPMLGPIDVTLLDDDNIRPFPTLYLGVAPEDFIHLEEEDEESVTFSFHWIEGDITSAQGEETGGGLRFRKSLFEGGKTVSLKLTPYDGTPFVLHLRIPVKGFQLLDADERPHQGELVVDPATARVSVSVCRHPQRRPLHHCHQRRPAHPALHLAGGRHADAARPQERIGRRGHNTRQRITHGTDDARRRSPREVQGAPMAHRCQESVDCGGRPTRMHSFCPRSPCFPRLSANGGQRARKIGARIARHGGAPLLPMVLDG